MILRTLAEAEREVAEAVRHYKDKAPDTAEQFIRAYDVAIQRMISFPEAWPPAGRGLRRCLLSRFPYQIVYRVDGQSILIIAVAHNRRRPGYWRKRMPKPAAP